MYYDNSIAAQAQQTLLQNKHIVTEAGSGYRRVCIAYNGVPNLYAVNILITKSQRCRCGGPIQREKQRLLMNWFTVAL